MQLLIVITKHQSVFYKNVYLLYVVQDVTTPKIPFFVTFVPEVYIQKQVSKNSFMSKDQY